MSFVRLAPQVVQHTDGYKVYVADRFHVAYEERGRVAHAEADLEGPRVAVRARSLHWIAPEQAEPTLDEAKLILERISAGLGAMEGVRADIA